jgi:hypothetical protein
MYKYALLVATLNNTSPTFQAVENNIENFVESNSSEFIAASLALSQIPELPEYALLFFEMLSPVKLKSKKLLLGIMAVGDYIPSTASIYTSKDLSKIFVYTPFLELHTSCYAMFMWLTEEKEECHQIMNNIRRIAKDKDIHILCNELDISHLINPYTIAENTFNG